MVKYTFVSVDQREIDVLQRHFATRDVPLRFSRTVPVIRIPEIDAICFTVMGYEGLCDGISVNFRQEFQDSVVRESTSEMQARGLSRYIVVSRLLRESEDPNAADTRAAVLASVMRAVADFNHAHDSDLIRHVAALVDDFRPGKGARAEDVAVVIEKALLLKDKMGAQSERKQTLTLYRPVGQSEYRLIEASGFRGFPPRLPEQPIFYPVTNHAYAAAIARDWNTREPAGVGYVLAFDVDRAFIEHYAQHQVGSKMHTEYWIPAEDLEQFNRHIVGPIRVAECFER